MSKLPSEKSAPSSTQSHPPSFTIKGSLSGLIALEECLPYSLPVQEAKGRQHGDNEL